MLTEIIFQPNEKSIIFNIETIAIGERIFLNKSGIWVVREVVHLPDKLIGIKKQIIVSKPTQKENGNS